MSLRTWLRGRRLDLDDEDFKAEVQAHLAMATKDRVADGADPEAARFAALKEFGNVTLTTEAARRVWRPRWVEALHDLWLDVRYAARSLRTHPAFALTVIAVLTIGIGLNATVFTMLKAIAISPIAGVPGSSAMVVVLRETDAGRQVRLSYPDYRLLREREPSMQGLMASVVAAVGLGRGRESRALWGEFVTGNYFQAMGVRASLGRTVLPSDENPSGGEPVVVISDGLWRRDFGADPRVIGRTLEINGTQFTIVGVVDPSFHGTTVVYDVEVFVPLTMAPQLGFRFGSQETTPAAVLADRRAQVLYPQGFLPAGMSLDRARAGADAFWTTLAPERPVTDPREHLRVEPFWRTPNGAPLILRPVLTVLTVTGLLVLVIACANIAGLVLVRGLARRGEIAVRLALGATRRRIVRLLVVENLLLAIPGVVLGVLVAANGVPWFVAQAENLAAPRRLFFNVEVDRLVMAFSVFVACGSALVFGFVPALQSSRIDLVTAINEDASPRGASRARGRGALVVAQVAVSLVLLVGAALVTRSLDAARHTSPGFDPNHLTAISMDVKQAGLDEPEGRVFYRRLIESMRRSSGTDTATVALLGPLNLFATRAQRVEIDGYVPRKDDDLAFMWNAVGPDYFRTMRIPLVAGRDVLDRDDKATERVAVVNRTFAERFLGEPRRAIGRHIRVGDGEWRTIVGVAGDVKYLRLDEPPRPYVYLPVFQVYRSDLLLHTRGPAPSEAQVARARAEIAALAPNLPLMFARPMDDEMRGATIFMNLSAFMLFVFGATGIALAALGTYGLVSYTVTQSTRDIGIRMALGASALSVARAFVGRGVRLGVIGAVVGTAIALATSQLLGSVLFGVSATDPASFARALAIVLVTVALASLVPAWRASKTDPLKALRHQ
jgi:predicted permease